jgi:hypothetical protein
MRAKEPTFPDDATKPAVFPSLKEKTETIADLQREIDQADAVLDAAQTIKLPGDITKFVPGQIGTITRYNGMEIFQVINKTEVIVKNSDDKLFYLTDYPTANLVDGQFINDGEVFDIRHGRVESWGNPAYFEVMGTKT